MKRQALGGVGAFLFLLALLLAPWQATRQALAAGQADLHVVQYSRSSLHEFAQRVKSAIRGRFNVDEQRLEDLAWFFVARMLRTRQPLQRLIATLEVRDVEGEIGYWNGFFHGDLGYWRSHCEWVGCAPVQKMCGQCATVRNRFARDVCYSTILREGYRCY